MKSINFLILATVLATLFFDIGYSIKCYDCSSKNNPSCGDPFKNDTTFFVDCEQVIPPPELNGTKAVACKKMIEKDGNKTNIIRSCSYLPPKEKTLDLCVKENPYNVSITSCYICDDKAGCNSAPATYSTLFLQIIIPTCFMYILTL